MTIGNDNAKVCVGVITTVHGVRGNVKVKSFTQNAADFASFGTLSDASGKRSFKMKIVGELKDQFLAAVDGIKDRTQAETLRGVELFVDRSLLPQAEENEFYYADLIGLDAKTAEGEILGKVKAVFNFGAGDMLEIENVADFIPFSNQCVPDVDLKAGFLTVILPETVSAEPPKKPFSDDNKSRKKAPEKNCKKDG